MTANLRPYLLVVFLLAIVAFALASTPFAAHADHSWGSYHWGRTSNSFTVKLGDNLSNNWKTHLRTASSDWSKSTVLDTVIVTGSSTSRKCAPTAGRVEVCNDTYGNNGWLGIAQVWTSGGHIIQGTTKMNDSYFNMPAYNTTEKRNHVMCQEIGHTFGLGHQDESGASLGTCMDYARDSRNSQHPDAHDYEQLKTIYSHVDSTNTATALSDEVANADLRTPAEWGRLVSTSADGHVSTYERDFGNGIRIFSFVFWADEHPGHEHEHHDH